MISGLIHALEQHQEPQKAEKMESYMRHQFAFYGIQSALRRTLSRSFLQEYKKSDFSTIKKIISQLWKQDKRECQYVAMDLFSNHLKNLNENDLSFIENIILTKSWWDTVDWLAGHAVGTYLNLYPEKKINVLSRWSDSENIWLIRSCIIFQLFYKEQTDTKILEDMILGHTGTNEFFINKASGWALRQYSKTNPKWVIDFVNNHVDVLDKLTCTEALKWLKNNNLYK